MQQEDLKEVVEKLQLTLQTDWSTDSLKKPNSNNSPEEELLFTHEQRKEHLLRVQQRHMDEEREELEAKTGEEEGHKTSEKVGFIIKRVLFKVVLLSLLVSLDPFILLLPNHFD